MPVCVAKTERVKESDEPTIIIIRAIGDQSKRHPSCSARKQLVVLKKNKAKGLISSLIKKKRVCTVNYRKTGQKPVQQNRPKGT
jgi:hypothetical protein